MFKSIMLSSAVMMGCFILPALAQDTEIPKTSSEQVLLAKKTGNIALEELSNMVEGDPRSLTVSDRGEITRVIEIKEEAGEIETLRAIAANIRYVRTNDIISIRPFNPEVTAQWRLLSDQILAGLATGGLGTIPLPNEEQRHIAYDFYGVLAPGGKVSPLCPYGRKKYSQEDVQRIVELIKERLQSLPKYRARLLMSSPEFSESERAELWRAFIRQSVWELILQEHVHDINNKIFAEQAILFGKTQRSVNNEDSSQKSLLIRNKDEADRLSHALLSQERTLAIVSSLASSAIAIEKAETTSVPEIHRCIIDLKEGGEAGTNVKMHAAIVATHKYWVFEISNVESNDGNVLDEAQLECRCFVYDRGMNSLQMSSENGRQLAEVYGTNKQRRGRLHCFDSYSKADIGEALTFMNGVALVGEMFENGSNDGKTEKRWKLPDLYDVSLKAMNRTTTSLDHVQIEFGTDDGTSKATAEYVGKGSSNLYSLQLRGLNWCTILGAATALHGADKNQTQEEIPVVMSLFEQGLSIQLGQGPAQGAKGLGTRFRKWSDVVAPGRLAAMTTEYGLPLPLAKSINYQDVDKLDPVIVASQMIDNDSVWKAHDITNGLFALDESSSDVVTKCERLYNEARVLESDESMPMSCAFTLRDLMIGAANRLNRRGQALDLLAKQMRALETANDEKMAQEYKDFYNRRLNEETSLTKQAGEGRPWLACYTTLKSQVYSKPTTRAIAVELKQPDSLLQTYPISVENVGDPRDDLNMKDAVFQLIVAEKFDALQQKRAEEVFERLWREHPQLSKCEKAAAKMMLSEVKQSLDSMKLTQDMYKFTNMAITLRWRLYHGLYARTAPLSAAAIEVKNHQESILKDYLLRIKEGLDVDGVFGESVRGEAVAESRRSVEVLKSSMNSALNPLCYYPLPESSFEEVMQMLDLKKASLTATFQKDVAAKRQEMKIAELTMARQGIPRIDFFQNEFRSWAAARARVTISYLLGEEFRQYCLKARKSDFDDARMFPLTRVQGITVEYRRIEGLSCQLLPKYVEVEKP